MASQYVIGIDIGTSGCKTIILDDNGNVICRATQEYPLDTPQPGYSEQDPEDWWQAVIDTSTQVLQNIDRPSEIKGIGLSGQMHGLVCLDKDGEVLRPAILWNDQRTGKQCQQIHDIAGGIHGLLKYTNNQMLPGYTGGKILWLREHEPHLFEKLHTFLNPKDYIRYKLTGEFATEVSDASGTGLFDVRDRKWSFDLTEKLELPKSIFPKCYESHEISGVISKQAAELTGLTEGLPVAGGGGDAVVQTTGTGLVNPGILGTTLGTAGNASMALDKCFENRGAKLQIFCNNLPDRWHCMGVTLAAGGSLRWARDMLGGSESDIARWTGEDVYSIFMKEAKRAQPGCEGLFFLPYLIGERCPHPDPNARGGFIGLTLRHDRSSMLRSILEGAIYSLKDVTSLIEDMGITVDEIRTSGGGVKSELWRQIHADIFGTSVVTVSGAAEGGAYGAALLAGVGVGIWPSVEEATEMIEVENRTEPIAKNNEIYQKLFPIYKSFYGQLKSSFDEIAAIYYG